MELKFKLKDVAEFCEGELAGDPEKEVGAPAPIEIAAEDSIVYLTDLKKTELLGALKAGCLILPQTAKGTDLPFKGDIIYVKDPRRAFSHVLRRVYLKKRPHLGHGVDPKAHVAPTACIGKFVYIGPYAVVEKDARVEDYSVIYPGCYIGHRAKVGHSCILYPNVVVREDCVIGDRAIIHPGAVIGADGFGYIQTDRGHEKIHQVGRVVIESDVEIGANTTIDRGTVGDTLIGAGTKIDNQVQIAHNVRMGRACLVVSQAGIAGSSSLGDGVVIAGQVGVVDHVKIGSRAIITAGTGVMNDVPDGAVYFGAPGKPHGEAMRIQAVLGKLPEMYRDFRKMKKIAENPAGGVHAELAELRAKIAELENKISETHKHHQGHH